MMKVRAMMIARTPVCPLAALLVATALSAPAMAQSEPGIDPRAATALTTMTGIAGEYCRRGSKEACAFNDKLAVATTRLVAAQEACGRGLQIGCEAVEMGVAELSIAYRRFGGGRALGRTVPGTPEAPRAPGAGPDLFGN